MMNFLASCGMCSSVPKPGEYAYEEFSRLPSLEAFSNPALISNEKWPGGNQPVSSVSDRFINNVPIKSVVAGDYTFKDLVKDNPNNIVRKILKSEYAKLIKEHEQSGKVFSDLDFPPNQSSIGEVEDLRVRATWKRIPHIIKDAVFVEGKIEPNDVFQGSLGDCYFLSAISALSEKDFRIKNIFPSLTMNRHGIYMARVLYRGVLREVVVDDYVPVNQQGDPLFAKPINGREIWIMILQKCWAKLHGSYGAIVGGLPNQVLHAFSGAPTFYHQISKNKDKQQQLWRQLWQANINEAILCCATRSDNDVEQCGLRKGHAYTILNLYQQPHRMIKLRNPWKNIEWRGRACDSDNQFWSTISPNDRQRLGYTQRSDGSFFMLWNDFVNLFSMVDICKLNDNGSFSNVEYQFDRKRAEMVEFETKGGSITLSLSQQSLNGKSENVVRRQYARSLIIVAYHDEASQGYEYKYVSSSSSNEFYTHQLELTNLKPGKYVVYAKVNWIYRSSEKASISIYTISPVHLFQTKQCKHSKYLYKVFLDHARNNSKKQSIGPGEWICSDLLLSQCGYGYLAFHLDDKSTRKLGVQILESEYTEKRFILKKPYRGRGIIKTSVAPGKELIFLFRIKSQNFPSSVTLPAPKIYNLI